MQAVMDSWIARVLDAAVYLRWHRIPRRYKAARGKWPSVAFPRTYSERIQWRKVFDHNPDFVTFSDKLAGKEYIRRTCPELAVPRTLWVGTRIEDAPAELLAGDVAVKANCGSGTNFFIRGGQYDAAELRERTAAWMARPFGGRNAEWAYGPIPRLLFLEELLGTPEDPLVEINIRAGRGRIAHGSLTLWGKSPRQSVVDIDEHGVRRNIRLGEGVEAAEVEGIAVPPGYMDAVRHAARMSLDLDFARYDFLWANGRLHGGEITIYPASGYAPENPHERTVLETWDLRTSWFMTARLTGWRAVYREALRRHLDRTGQ